MKYLPKKLEINLIALLSITIVAISAITFASSLDLGLNLNITHEKTCKNVEQKPVLFTNMSSYAFGNQSTGTTRSTNIALTNSGNAALTDIVFQPFSSAVFMHSSSVSSSCGTTLAAKATCYRKVSFTPVAATAYSDTLVVSSNQLDDVTVPVSGTGTQSVTYTFTAYLAADSTSTEMQKGTGTLTMGSAVTATAAQVGNGWNMGIAADATGRVLMPTSENISGTVGTMGFWIKNDSTAAYSAPVSWGADNLSFSNTSATNWPFVLRYKGANTTSIALPVGEWHFVELAWKSDENKAAIRRDGGTWAEITNAVGTAPSSANIGFGDISATTKKCSFDNIIISSTYKDENVYAKRNDTDF